MSLVGCLKAVYWLVVFPNSVLIIGCQTFPELSLSYIFLYIGRPWSALSFEGSRGVVVGQILDSLTFTSNGGCRREEKSRKHWSLFTKILSSIRRVGQGHAGYATACLVVGTLMLPGHQSLKKKEGRMKEKE